MGFQRYLVCCETEEARGGLNVGISNQRALQEGRVISILYNTRVSFLLNFSHTQLSTFANLAYAHKFYI